MITIPVLFAAVVGFNHAFEMDHILAVGNIANKRSSFRIALKDGMYWGLGHSSTVFLVGCALILMKIVVSESVFDFLEIIVGVSLVVLGIYRFMKVVNPKVREIELDSTHDHKLAYSIGLLHGLAGSGAVVLLVLTELPSTSESIMYLLFFGAGSVAGMMIAAALFNLPISRKFKDHNYLQYGFVGVSSLLCIGYGIWMIVRFMN